MVRYSVLLFAGVLTLTAAGGLFAAGATDAGAGSVAVNPAGTFPIVDEKITMTAFNIQVSVPDAATNSFITWYEDLTNVHIEWEHAPGDGGREKRSLLLASGDYPEIFISEVTMRKEEELRYGTQGIIRDLSGLIDEWGFFVKQAFADEPWLRAALTTPDGAIYSLPGLELGCFHCDYSQKMWINQVWLDRLGLATPETTDEFYEVLKAFKTQDPNQNGKADEIPLMFATSGWHADGIGYLMGSFVYHPGLSSDVGAQLFYFTVKNGQIKFTANQPAFREGLRYIRKLVTDGLLDPLSFTQRGDDMIRVGANPDAVLIGAAPGGVPFTFLDRPTDRVNIYEGLAPLRGPEGVRLSARYTDRAPSTGMYFITDKAQHPEVALRWGDGMLDPAGDIRFRQNGVEGSEWRKGLPGELDYHGRPAAFVRTLNQEHNAGNKNNAAWYDGPRYIRREHFESQVAGTDRNTTGLGYLLFEVSVRLMEPYQPELGLRDPYLRAEVVSEAAQLRTAIHSHVNESTVRFLVGDLDLDADWDDYVKQLDDLGVDRFVEIYADAYAPQFR